MTDNHGKTLNGLSLSIGTPLQFMEFSHPEKLSSGDGHWWSQVLRVSKNNEQCS